MKTSFAVAAFTLLAGALAAPPTLDTRQAAPTFELVTFSVINDISGANEQRVVRTDGSINKLGDLFAGSRLANANGRIIATSAQLVTVIPGALCIFKDEHEIPMGLLNERLTFTGLDGVEEKAIETDVTGFTFTCER